MINHALITGLRYSKASPITDDPFHRMIFDYKVNRALKNVKIRDMLESVAYQKIKQNEIAKELLLDLDLAIISPKLPMEAILEYRNENEDKLKEARTELLWLARKIRENPYTKAFRDKIYHDIIPKDIYGVLKECKNNQKKWLKNNEKRWLKPLGLGVKAAAAVIPLILGVLPHVTIPLYILALALTEGRNILSKWKKSKEEEINGLHYFFDLANIRQ